MQYKITRIDIRTEKEDNYGTWGEDDMKAIVRGYKFNGLFWERKNGKYIFIVEEVA